MICKLLELLLVERDEGVQGMSGEMFECVLTERVRGRGSTQREAVQKAVSVLPYLPEESNVTTTCYEHRQGDLWEAVIEWDVVHKFPWTGGDPERQE